MITQEQVFQFRVSLDGVSPEVWRRIQVPGAYTFWDLHVALQDAMGWSDSHLHKFEAIDPDSGEPEEIGIPDPGGFGFGMEVSPGWERSISSYFTEAGLSMTYRYDFGDDWEHTLLLEDIDSREEGAEYPRCLDGERACPPEDCGGAPGYQLFLEILGDPTHEQHDEMVEWQGGDFDPDAFDPEIVRFDDPAKRWAMAFGPE